jgi:hypothetical protein
MLREFMIQRLKVGYFVGTTDFDGGALSRRVESHVIERVLLGASFGARDTSKLYSLLLVSSMHDHGSNQSQQLEVHHVSAAA